MGAYTDVTGASSKLRYSPLDCPPVGADPVACPGRPALGSGGFTYGDFGRDRAAAPRCTPTARSGRRPSGTCAPRWGSRRLGRW